MGDEVLTDPLGRRIILHDRTWYGHILAGHPELEGFREMVCRAVSTPNEIRISRSDKDCRLHFLVDEEGMNRIVVVVDLVQGLVKTAHFSRSVSGGRREWPW